jgi:hypothetical protein
MSIESDPYVPTLKHPPSPGFTTGGNLSGQGAPADSLGENGQLYVDLDTGSVYEKLSGSWTLFSAGAGVTPQVFGASADPNGVQSCAGPGFVIGRGAVDGTIWKKSTAGTSNNEWEILIAGP